MAKTFQEKNFLLTIPTKIFKKQSFWNSLELLMAKTAANHNNFKHSLNKGL